MDFHMSPAAPFTADTDPGVLAVKNMHLYNAARHSFTTIMMPASWRPLGSDPAAEIKALAGVDRMTIPPALLDALHKSNDPLPQQIFASPPPAALDEREGVPQETESG